MTVTYKSNQVCHPCSPDWCQTLMKWDTRFPIWLRWSSTAAAAAAAAGAAAGGRCPTTSNFATQFGDMGDPRTDDYSTRENIVIGCWGYIFDLYRMMENTDRPHELIRID